MRNMMNGNKCTEVQKTKQTYLYDNEHQSCTQNVTHLSGQRSTKVHQS